MQRIAEPPLPLDVCLECTVDWEDLGYYPQWVRKLPDGSFRYEYDYPEGAPGHRYSYEDDRTGLSGYEDAGIVKVDWKQVGVIAHIGTRQFTAVRTFADPRKRVALGVFPARRYAMRAIVQDVTGEVLPVRCPDGTRQASYAGKWG